MAKCKDCIHYDLCLSHPTLSYSCLDVKEQTRKWFKEAKDVVEVKHAYWERIPGAYRCSECHCSPTLDGSGNWALTKYCHNCGAKMDLEEMI